MKKSKINKILILLKSIIENTDIFSQKIKER